MHECDTNTFHIIFTHNQASGTLQTDTKYGIQFLHCFQFTSRSITNLKHSINIEWIWKPWIASTKNLFIISDFPFAVTMYCYFYYYCHRRTSKYRLTDYLVWIDKKIVLLSAEFEFKHSMRRNEFKKKKNSLLAA